MHLRVRRLEPNKDVNTMPSPTYWFEKIHEAISKPKGPHAELALGKNGYIDCLLDDSKDSPDFDEIQVLLEELREHIHKNRTSKFSTFGAARKLVTRLRKLIK